MAKSKKTVEAEGVSITMELEGSDEFVMMVEDKPHGMDQMQEITEDAIRTQQKAFDPTRYAELFREMRAAKASATSTSLDDDPIATASDPKSLREALDVARQVIADSEIRIQTEPAGDLRKMTLSGKAAGAQAMELSVLEPLNVSTPGGPSTPSSPVGPGITSLDGGEVVADNGTPAPALVRGLTWRASTTGSQDPDNQSLTNRGKSSSVQVTLIGANVGNATNIMGINLNAGVFFNTNTEVQPSTSTTGIGGSGTGSTPTLPTPTPPAPTPTLPIP